ncbi:C6 zinc finger domain-containing protein [Cadophora sp. MPI-SDFR-AT-0126]|nr:C6 zinc finger domain-containing protein [Leotiomycetes sp. MPI-SDFR-AT-0126]
MDTSQFYLDPDFVFDPSLVDFPPLDMAQTQSSGPGEPIDSGSGPGQQKMKSRIRASRACIACRSRHMKCDSVEPVCTRCQLYGKQCIYTKSRRGGSHKAPPLPTTSPKVTPQTQTPGSANRTPSTGNDTEFSPTFSPLEARPRSQNQDLDLLASYYEFFNNAHPVVLPKRHFQARLHSNPSSLAYLLPVIHYIGSVYHPSIPSSPYLSLAESALSSPSLPIDGFSVQALTLFALARHCSDEYAIADKYVDRAIDTALALGMNRQEWAEENGEGDAVLVESWRRTWWLLFTVDGLFATISHYCTHRLQNVVMDVDLPCEDVEYESGNIPTPRTFAQYDSREFHDQEITFSSLTYLLDAIRMLSHSMSIIHSPHEPGDKALTSTDAKFVNWGLYLPYCKREIVRPDGTVDETMFFAHLVVNTELLILHRPTSHLPYSPHETLSKCTPPHPHTSSSSPSIQRSLAMHTTKALEALSTSITLFALPGDNIKHSPIATCALALAVMAQASACRLFSSSSSSSSSGRDRVRLGLGALRAGVRVWGLARRSVREVVGVARELLEGDGNVNGDRGREMEGKSRSSSKNGATVETVGCESIDCVGGEMAMGGGGDAVVMSEGMTV